MASLRTALSIFWTPGRALAEASEKRLFAWPLLLLLASSLGYSALSLRALDLERAADAQVEKAQQGPDAKKLTPHERDEAVAAKRKVATVAALAGGALGPPFRLLGLAFCLWLGFIVAGGKPAFGSTFAVAAHGSLPLALGQLAAYPALLTHRGLEASELERLLPSNLAALLAPAGAGFSPRVAVLGAVDLFALWSLALIAAGMVAAAGVSKVRSAATSLFLFCAYVAVFHVALPAFGQGAGP